MKLEDDAIIVDLQPQFAKLFIQYREALHLLEDLFDPLPKAAYVDKLQEVIFRHCGRCVSMIRSVSFLCRFGHGLDCIILLRALVEHTINAYYLAYQKRRKGLWRYLKYGRIEQWDNFRKLLEFQQTWNRCPTIHDQLGKKKVTEMRRLYHRSKKGFQTASGRLKHSWCEIDLRQRAQFVDREIRSTGQLEELYMIVTKQMGNPVTHGTALALTQVPRGQGEVFLDASPSDHWVEPCLRIGLCCVFLTAQLANIVGKMKRDDLVRRIEDKCRP